MGSEFTMHSITDLSSYSLPVELLFGNLRSTTEYNCLETLGDGSSSTVLKAHDRKENKMIAMKVYKQIIQNSSALINKEIFREITILKNLDHENVIKLHHVVTGSGIYNLCLILDYCPHPLDKLIDRYPVKIPHDQVKIIAKQMLSGLRYLHHNYIVHRDLKTSNLMISSEGILKIVDFGLSKRYVLQDRETMTPDVITRWYQPLEILLGAPGYGIEVDSWSAGCVLIELFQKKPLFPGESQIHQINLIIDLLGTPTPNVWPGLSKCKEMKIIRLKNQPFNKLNEKVRELGCSACLEILSGLLAYDPNKRLSPAECLEHDWFEQAPLPAKSIRIPKAPIVPRAPMPTMPALPPTAMSRPRAS